MWLDTIMHVFPLEEKLEDLKKFSDLVVLETCKYAKETTEHLAIAIVAYICLCIVFYYLSVYLKSAGDYGQLKAVKRVLFVTAHPDDECMFFGPAILKLAQRKDCELYLLCLSQGNYDHQGSIRRQELYDSCKILGIPDSNIMLYKNEYLPDNPKLRWHEDVIAQLLLNHIEALDIDTVITFDKLGVSGHLNHVSIFYATAYLCMERKLPSYCRAYALESINKLRKYSVMLDVPISYLLSSYWYIIPLRDRNIIKRAMAAHKSQYVWFRKLYFFFSRYCLVNTLKEIEILDLELDLELDD